MVDDAKEQTVARLEVARDIIASALEGCPNDKGDGPVAWYGEGYAQRHIRNAAREIEDALAVFAGKTTSVFRENQQQLAHATARRGGR